ncbi:uncharacterized protein LOC123315844 [Coccinella septempunctata]|uniref:uncharacterized protein LOC123315844 n=1 Tax=Coccinella septempunctata TaxID=41139 RepID=UPI001D0903C5|nr:uncharacterized protein LOC123315844 [Coccinella septempunctata]
MKYFLLLVVFISIYCIQEGYTDDDDDDDDELTCFKCKSPSYYECRVADDAGPTCFGKYCMAYIYPEKIKGFAGGQGKKDWYIRGCTDDKDFCKGESHKACTLCTEHECNVKTLPEHS